MIYMNIEKGFSVLFVASILVLGALSLPQLSQGDDVFAIRETFAVLGFTIVPVLTDVYGDEGDSNGESAGDSSAGETSGESTAGDSSAGETSGDSTAGETSGESTADSAPGESPADSAPGESTADSAPGESTRALKSWKASSLKKAP